MNRYGPINYLYGLLQDLPHPLHTTLYSMADLRKQVNEGQEKWRQRVDLTSITNVNNYIKFKVFKYKYFKLINDDL
jgi:hypothetical protein